MSVYNRQNQEFVPLAETSGILQNMTSSNIEYVVCADGETPEFNTGIRLSPSKKLKFSQTVGVSYVRVVGNTTGDIIVFPNDEASSGGGSTTRIINHVHDWQPDTLYPTGTLVIYNNVLYKCVVPNHKTIFDPADWVVIGAGNDSGKGISVWNSQTNYKVDDIILHGNTLYVCVNEHVSSTEFGDDTDYWVVITDNAGTVLPDWQAREKYEKDEIVNVGGFIYRCKSPHISRDTFATMNDVVGDEDYWELISWVDWHTETQYLKDQIVYCDGALWRCLANHVSDNTSISNDSDKWIKICGYTLPVASDSILGGVKVGSNITINANGTISLTRDNITNALGYTPPEQDTDTTYPAVTYLENGLMLADDKKMLDYIVNTYWKPSTAYALGDTANHYALPPSYYLECTTPGTTGATAPVISSVTAGDTITDGSVVWTVRKCFPTSGGQFEPGNVVIAKIDSSGQIVIIGGTTGSTGASLTLKGMSNDLTGQFRLKTVNNANQSHELVGSSPLSGGTLTWDGNDLAGSAIVAKQIAGHYGYRKTADGFLMQWGKISISGSRVYDITYPISFANGQEIQFFCTISANSSGGTPSGTAIRTLSTTYPDSINNPVGTSVYINSINGTFYTLSWLAVSRG